ncbi:MULTISPECIES: hypothetical protein [unclassified Methylobacterium]|jgi:hypothetical protein|uniref:hypothetical protein n=1 Tax=unclassified Methylobacterium TaxID=2615210 RepID=UPI0011C20E2B|nr:MULTISPECIES: hypothetical protein [unclassified Methylobacterium]QEE38156.1 hypothetical protein FVA80_03355 [Methylobacterium sp. WL1]TXN01536.1 hypothetical protein FV242_18185 [Methylobacterium sp. WL64]TXN60003.1 hypothetical protein FV241_01185 [Methylobacterium sp. WL2]
MFESLFWGAAIMALVGSAALVAIGAAVQPRIIQKDEVGSGILDSRRTFGRKRRWRRPSRVTRRLGWLPLR